MLSKLMMRRKSGGLAVTRDDSKRIAPAFEKLESVADAKTVLRDLGLIRPTGLDADTVSMLFGASELLRSKGLGLEPNLLGRATCLSIIDRAAAGAATDRFAVRDSDFMHHASDADDKRNRGQFADAQFSYWLALQLYPFHAGYLIQYAHCLKERDLLADAVVNYIDALLFGAALADVEQHLRFSAQQIASPDVLSNLLSSINSGVGSASAMSRRLSSEDARALIQLFLNRMPSVGEIAACMCEHKDRSSLIKHLMADDDFAKAHRDLIRMSVELERSSA